MRALHLQLVGDGDLGWMVDGQGDEELSVVGFGIGNGEGRAEVPSCIPGIAEGLVEETFKTFFAFVVEVAFEDDHKKTVEQLMGDVHATTGFSACKKVDVDGFGSTSAEGEDVLLVVFVDDNDIVETFYAIAFGLRVEADFYLKAFARNGGEVILK